MPAVVVTVVRELVHLLLVLAPVGRFVRYQGGLATLDALVFEDDLRTRVVLAYIRVVMMQ